MTTQHEGNPNPNDRLEKIVMSQLQSTNHQKDARIAGLNWGHKDGGDECVKRIVHDRNVSHPNPRTPTC